MDTGTFKNSIIQNIQERHDIGANLVQLNGVFECIATCILDGYLVVFCSDALSFDKG